MPADAPIVGLVTWRNAKTDPPQRAQVVPTDTPSPGHYVAPTPPDDVDGYCGHAGGWYDQRGLRLDPQPSLWCDPSPPAAGPHGTLTLAGLRHLTLAGQPGAYIDRAAVERLRAQLLKEETT